jgi:hypothetical protein
MTVQGGASGEQARDDRTNTLAITSLIASFVGVLFPLASVAGIGLGAVAVGQIRQTRQSGYGLAIAGVVVSIATLVTYLVFMITFGMH